MSYYNFETDKYSEKELREFIENNPEKLDPPIWYDISRFQILSEEFIRDFNDKLSWYWMSLHQKLSESLIRDFQDRVNWYWISAYQDLSEEFMIEFIENIDTWYLERNKLITEDVKKRIISLEKVIYQ